MKLYKIEYTTLEGQDRTEYKGTIANAKAAQKELERVYGKHNVANYEPIEVPTDKPGLLEWLNTNAGKG